MRGEKGQDADRDGTWPIGVWDHFIVPLLHERTFLITKKLNNNKTLPWRADGARAAGEAAVPLRMAGVHTPFTEGSSSPLPSWVRLQQETRFPSV